MINYDKLMKLKPIILDTITNSQGQEIDYIENPTNPQGEIIAIYRKEKVACFTGFFDTEDFYKGSDYEYIYIHSYEALVCSYEL